MLFNAFKFCVHGIIKKRREEEEKGGVETRNPFEEFATRSATSLRGGREKSLFSEKLNREGEG